MGLYQADAHRGQSLLSCAQHCDHNLCLATSSQASELHHLSFTQGSSCTLLSDQSRRNPDLANLILAPVKAGLGEGDLEFRNHHPTPIEWRHFPLVRDMDSPSSQSH